MFKRIVIWVRPKRRRPTIASKLRYQEHSPEARRLVRARLAEFSQFYGVKIGRVSIRNQWTRWGSCSKAGNLNFNYRLALIDADLADYVIVHEVCHLLEFNHSPAFWSLVAQAIPDYRLRRRRLKALKIQ